jgi:hypothetical protein
MTSFDRVVWGCSWVAPFAWIIALLAFVLSLIPATLVLPTGFDRGLPVVALVGASLGLLGHTILGYHVLRSPAFSSQERGALWRDYLLGVGYQRWRRVMRSHQS